MQIKSLFRYVSKLSNENSMAMLSEMLIVDVSSWPSIALPVNNAHTSARDAGSEISFSERNLLDSVVLSSSHIFSSSSSVTDFWLQ